MAEIILKDAVCAECEKQLERFSLAVVYTDDFIVCVQCEQEAQTGWEEFLEFHRMGLI